MKLNHMIGQWLQVDHCTLSRGCYLIVRRMDGYYMLTCPGNDSWMDTTIHTFSDAVSWAERIIDAHYGGCYVCDND